MIVLPAAHNVAVLEEVVQQRARCEIWGERQGHDGHWRGVQGLTSRSPWNQALDVRVVQGNALDQLPVHLELDRGAACHS
jgi:hypothetical protein